MTDTPLEIDGQMSLGFDVSAEDAVESFEASEDINSSFQGATQSTLETELGNRLTGLKLRNFKGFAEVDVEFAEFNVLVGMNNAGKSSILQAIRLGHLLLRQHYADSFSTKVQPGRTLPAALLPVAEPRDLWHNKRWRASRQPVTCSIALEMTGGLTFEFGLRLLYGAVNSKLLKYPQTISLDDLNKVRGLNPVLVPSSVGIVSHEEFRNAGRVDTLIQTGRHNEAVRNLLQGLFSDQPGKFQRLAQIVKTHFDVDLLPIAFDAGRDQYIDARYSEHGTDLDLFSAGAGLVQVIQLLAFVLRSPSGVVLLDEPDAHLHSSMQLIVVDMLEQLSREFGFQVLISTHSKEIINYVSPNLLIPVSNASKLHPLEPYTSAIAVLEELGALDNVDLYSLFASRRCAMVEGKSDRQVLTRLAAATGSTVFEGESRVVMVPAGGVTNFSASQSVKVFSAIAGFDIKFLYIRDRDGLSDENRESMMSEDETLYVHDLDCIESYLVSAETFAAIAKETFETQARSDSPPTVEEFTVIIEEATDSLRDETADRIAMSLDTWYAKHERTHKDVVTLQQEARTIREDVWDNPIQRLKYVPGKRLLAVCRDLVKTRFNLSLGTPALIEHMEPRFRDTLNSIVSRCEGL